MFGKLSNVDPTKLINVNLAIFSQRCIEYTLDSVRTVLSGSTSAEVCELKQMDKTKQVIDFCLPSLAFPLFLTGMTVEINLVQCHIM